MPSNWSGTLPPGTTTWVNTELQRIVGTVTVPVGATLVIDPGTVIKVNDYAGLSLIVDGTLNAQGTTGQPIIFTSLRDDSVYGDTMNDGQTPLAQGQWQKILLSSTSTANVMDHVEVRYGGNDTGGIVDDGGALSLSNSKLLDNYNAGLRIQNANPTVTNVTFQDNIFAASMDLASNPAISGVTMTNNSVNALKVDGGNLVGNRMWNDPQIAYLINSPVTVPQGQTLTIAAGQVVKFGFHANLTVNGTLSAAGTDSQKIIFTSADDDSAGGDTNNNGPSSGSVSWDFIHFNSTSTANLMDHVEVRFGGAGADPAEIFDNGAPLTLSNSVIRNSGQSGLRLVGVSSTTVLTDDSFLNNYSNAISVDLASHPAINGATTMTGNNLNAVVLDTGSLPADNAWDNAGVVYWVTDITIPAATTLTVAAGQVVKFDFHARLTVNGTLNAPGTDSQKIIFTSYNDDSDSAGGHTYKGSSGNPGAGEWDFIHFGSTSTASFLSNVEIRYAGGAYPAAVIDSGAPLTLSNSVVRNSNSSGLRLEGVSSTTILTDDRFQDNATNAISMDLASHPVINGVTMTGNNLNAVVLDSGSLPADNAWDNTSSVVYWVPNPGITIPAGITLTVTPGQIIKFYFHANLTVNGSLSAVGTAAQPIIFTSYDDDSDSAGGHTFKGSSGAPGAGEWDFIHLGSTSTANLLDHVEVRYGGGGADSAEVFDNGAPLTLSNSLIRNSAQGGLRLVGVGSTVTVAGDTFKDNHDAAISIDLASNPSANSISAMGNGSDSILVDGGTLASNVSWAGQGIPYRLAGDVTIPAGTTLSLAPGAVYNALDSRNLLGAGTINNAGTLKKSSGGGTSTVTPQIVNTGLVKVLSGTFNFSNAVANNNSGWLAGSLGATLALADNLMGDTRNASLFTPQASLLFNGAGTSTSPQLLEALGQDRGVVAAGFDHNFVLYTLALANNTYVRLVDNADNAAGPGAESVYVDNLVVPSGTTLDLNGLHLYARNSTVNGTVTAGTVGAVADGGPLSIGTVTPGQISAVGESDDWTIFGRAGDTITVTVSTGASGVTPPLAPTLNYAQATLLEPSGNTLASASNTQTGADVTLAGITLPADGTYHVKVQAPNAQANSTDNYVITAWDASLHIAPLALNQNAVGRLDTPYRIDRWTFAATAGNVIKFNLVNEESSAIQFDLTGPNGYTAFSNWSASSDNINLPSDGTYAVTVHGTQRQTGAYAFRIEQTTVTELTLGTPLNAALIGGAQSQFFKVSVPQAQQLQVTLTDISGTDKNEVYLKFGATPTRSDYQYRFSTPASANQQVNVPTAAAGTWYILVYTEAAPQAGTVTLLATGASVFLTSVTPDHAGNAADTVLTLTGLGFDNATAVSLISAGNTSFPAASVHLDLPTQLTATFSAGAVPAGTYSVQVSNTGGGMATLVSAFNVVQGGQSHFVANLVAPSSLGFHVPAVIYINYSNTGDVAMLAPMLLFTITQTHAGGITDAMAFLTLDPARGIQGFWTSAFPAGYGHSVEFLASGSTSGVLQPGESMQVPVYYSGWQQPWDGSGPPFSFNLKVVKADDTTPFDWNDLKQSVPAPPIDSTAWDVIWSNLQAQTGSTWGNYITTLDQNALYLGQLGIHVNDMNQLFAFEIAQANGLSLVPQLATAVDALGDAPGLPLTFSRTFYAPITTRYQLGALGRGWSWSGGWDDILAVESDGTVVLTGSNGAQRRFKPDSRGGYFVEPGDQGKLTAGTGGTFTVTEQDGTVAGYRADGRVDYRADPNGNRITATYTGGLLTQLTHSSGQTLQVGYNDAGRISRVTDSVGRVTQYGYEPSNEHLLTVTDFAGQVTKYTYDLGDNPATHDALLSVANPDGTHVFYSYDSRGRLSDMHLDGNAEDVQFTYGAFGSVAATDAAGATATVFFDHRVLIAKLDDPLHRTTFLTYDHTGNLIGAVDPAGQRYVYSYDVHGNLTRSTDPLGNTVQASYAGAFDQVSSVTDAKGNSIGYGYDAKGNLTSTTYADGSVEHLAYDPVGNLINSTDRRGQSIQYGFDSSGRLLSKTFPDSTQVTYGYDAHGNLTSASDVNGTTTLTYDANDRLTKIAYPGARFLQYEYDAAGRRTKMTDQTNFTVNYSYDAAGRLSSLTDGLGSPIVTYTYDSVGQLQRKDNANLTYTTYDYDLDGQLLHLINHAPDNSISSRFDYTYDLLGRAATMTTLDGQWVYSYDATGQLIHAVFTSNNQGLVPNQDLQYSYDAAGNRTSTVINGVTTQYVTNNLNQYTLAGTVSYGYDANGNLIQKTDGGVTTTYAYDVQDQLVGISAPSDSWTYQYDPFGSQVAVTHNGQTTRNLIDPAGLGDVVGQFDGAGNLLAHYTYALGLVSRVDAGNVAAFYDFDLAGNSVALTGPSGAVINSYRYLPNGAALSISETLNNPFQFGGEVGVMTTGNGLDFIRARFYEVVAGRFTQLDPIGITGGLNLYRYASNDPVNRIDPSGLANTARIAIKVGVTAGEITYEEFLHVLANRLVAAGLQMNGFVTRSGQVLLDFAGRSGNLSEILDVLRSMTKKDVLGIARKLFTSTELSAVRGLIPKTGASVLRATVRPALATAAKYGKWGARGAALLEGLAFELGFGLGDWLSEDWEWKKSLSDKFYRLLPNALQDFLVPNGRAFDPNDKIGPAGFGAAGFVTPDHAFPYRIDFENEATATAPAQVVTVTDQLDTNLDWTTFALTDIGFGDTIVAIPPGTQHYQTTLPMTYNGKTFDVEIEAGLYWATGEVYATFQSIDPTTSLPPDVLTGFLPPEDGTGRGMGHIAYLVEPKKNLTTGTEIRNIASIVFDVNPAITTNQIDPHDPAAGTEPAKEARVTIDADAPIAAVNPLPQVASKPSFLVGWDGFDPAGAGYGSTDVYVSTDGSSYAPWQVNTTDWSATFTGQPGHRYDFIAIGHDLAGNVQPFVAAPQASVIVPNGPAAIDNAFVVTAGKTLSGSVLTNDLNPAPNRTLSAVLVDPPTAGTLTLMPNGKFTYVPSAAWSGRDSFTYRIHDNTGRDSNVARVELASQLVSFKRTKVTTSEGRGAATLTAQLSSPVMAPISVDYAVSPQTAQGHGTDFTLAAGTIAFAIGEKVKSIAVPLDNDALDEDNETLHVWLMAATGPVAVGTSRMSTITIADDDATPKLAFRSKQGAGTEDLSASVEVFLSAPSGRTVAVNYAAAGGTATAGSDYAVTPGMLTFAPGETSKFIPIAVIDDSQDEPDETVRLKLSRPVNAGLGSSKTYTYTIQCNDPLRSVAFDSANVSAGESAGTVLLTVRLSVASTFPVSVAYAFDGGTATPGKDFVLAAGTLTFKPGETEKKISVRLINDTMPEPDEMVQIRLSNPTNAIVGAVNELTLTIQDDD